MAKDQPGNNRSSSSSSSPPARRRARQVTQAKVVSNEGARRSRRKHRTHRSKDDWQTPEDENSGRVRKFVLVTGGVVAVVACGMLWQSSMGSEPIPAAEHPAISSGVASPEPGVVPANNPNDAPSNGTSESSTPTNLQEIWKGRLAELDSKRVEAFENRDLDALAEVNVPESPAQTHDARLVAAFDSRRLKPVSLATTIHSAALISGDNESALVEVVDSRGEYVVTTESMNRTVKRFKANEQAKWRVSLRNSERGWRIYSVTEVTD